MTTQELIQKIRQIEVKTIGLSNHIFAGDYHTAFKGRGMSFSEVREYSYGDDVRNIDWNVSARTSNPHIKVFEEERELTTMLLVDISASSSIGTTVQTKRDYITELSATLAFSALKNNDKVGLILFANKIEKYVPPKKGKTHVLSIIRDLLSVQPTQMGPTNIAQAIQFFNNIAKQKNIVFIVSDFIAPNYKTDLQVAQKRHDVVALHIYDSIEQSLPNIGLVKMRNIETHNTEWIDTSSKNVRTQYSNYFHATLQQLKNLFAKNYLSFNVAYNFVTPLHMFFKQRK